MGIRLLDGPADHLELVWIDHNQAAVPFFQRLAKVPGVPCGLHRHRIGGMHSLGKVSQRVNRPLFDLAFAVFPQSANRKTIPMQIDS